MFNRISHIAARVAGWVGDRTQLGVGDAVNTTQWDGLLSPSSLSHLLPYEAFDQVNALFLNKRSQGFILEIPPLLGAHEETVTLLTSILTDVLPFDTDLQFILWGTDKIGPILDAFEESRSQRGEIYQWLAKKRTDYLKQGIQASLSANGSLLLRDIRLFVAISRPQKHEENLTEQLVALRNDLISSLKSLQLPASCLQIEDFIGLLLNLLHPGSQLYPAKQRWNPYDELSVQLVHPEYALRVFKDKLQFENAQEIYEARALTVKDFPPSMAQWKMGEAIGQLFNSSLQIISPFVMTLSVHLIDPEKASLNAQLKYINKEKSSKSPVAKFMPLITQEYEEWALIRERLAVGDRLVQSYFQILVFAPTETAGAAERKVRDLFRANGWRLKKTAYLQLQSFLAMLPMMMSEGLRHDLKLLGRLRTMTAFNAANIAPLQGEWKGTSTPGLLLPGRRGQIAFYNPFDQTEGNYNVAIAAASGRGKSAFTQEYIVWLLGALGRVWVIDMGRSYEKTCKILGGTFIEFSAQTSISLNPFTHIKDFSASLTMLKPLLAAMAHPHNRATDEEMTFLEKALKAAWQEAGNAATISTVAKWLSQQDATVCQNLSHLLYSYTQEGMYGQHFTGPSTLDLSNHFVVLELQELKAKKDLQRIVMLVLMYHISEVMYLGERSQNKSCIIDEAWDLFGGENDGAAQFIETGYRTARRYNANFLTIVQSVNDYFKNSTTIAAFENSDTKLILGQTSEAIDQVRKSGRLTLDDFSERLLKSLRKTEDYSECVIKTPTGFSVHRIIFDPYARVLYSSRGEEYEQIKQLQANGQSLRDAIEIVARKFNYAK